MVTAGRSGVTLPIQNNKGLDPHSPLAIAEVIAFHSSLAIH